MSNASQPFDFSQFVPGFDFLKNLAGGAAAGAGGATAAVPGLPSLASWVAPTLSVEEVDKRIQELKTVQYWLEQNGHALKATIQALEVQKMTLSTLRGMNVRMEDIASAFTKQAAPAAAPVAAPSVEAEPEVEAEEEAPAPAKKTRSKTASATAASGGDGGVVDPMQWWGSLTEQFQQIATSALHDAAQLKVPAPAAAPASSKPAARKATATAAKKKAPTAARKRTTGRR
jgi:hypothetical protein